jgi:predicted esterase
MKKHEVRIEKTARYFTNAEPGLHIRQVWFICHGYGQMANYFLKQFEEIQDGSTLFVSCEGLHRFYLNGFSGRVGASWMTKEDRVGDIQDYIAYLDQVYAEVMEGLPATVSKTGFGFSQGTATVCRWLEAGKSTVDRLILWAGAFPSDVDLKLNAIRFNALKPILVLGSQDEFIAEPDLVSMQDRFTEAGIDYTVKRFAGKHELNADLLKTLL